MENNKNYQENLIRNDNLVINSNDFSQNENLYPNINSNPLANNQNFQINNAPDVYLLRAFPLLNIGFENRDYSTLCSKASGLIPNGKCALRDAIICGNGKLVEAANILADDVQNWKLLHIVVTKGIDDCSRANIDDVKGSIIQTLKTVRTSMKTVFVGIDINLNAESYELLQLASVSPENIEIILCNNDTLNTTFDNIKNKYVQGLNMNMFNANDGNLLAPQQVSLINNEKQYVNINIKQKIVVMLTIEFSGNIYFNNVWNYLFYNVNNFIRNLSPNNMVGAILFNEYVTLFQNRNMNIPIPQPIIYNPVVPTNNFNGNCALCAKISVIVLILMIMIIKLVLIFS